MKKLFKKQNWLHGLVSFLIMPILALLFAAFLYACVAELLLSLLLWRNYPKRVKKIWGQIFYSFLN